MAVNENDGMPRDANDLDGMLLPRAGRIRPSIEANAKTALSSRRVAAGWATVQDGYQAVVGAAAHSHPPYAGEQSISTAAAPY